MFCSVTKGKWIRREGGSIRIVCHNPGHLSLVMMEKGDIPFYNYLKNNYHFYLALAEAKSIGGTVLIHMFKYGTERRKIDLIKILESRFNILSILAGI